MHFNELELAQLQAEALFVHDANRRLLRVNEPEPEPPVPAPRFFLSRTAAGNLWRTRYDVPDALAAELERLAVDEPVVRDFDAPLRHTDEYEALLGGNTLEAHLSYWLPEQPPSTQAALLTTADAPLLQAHFGWLATTVPIYAPVGAVLADGAVVAVCFCSRITARVAEAGAYTAEAYRGHGYATEAARSWAAGVRAAGRLPLYSTTPDNFASQGIARKLGAVQYGMTYSVA
jgi:RimJ/RimL family protein N-acetyltransferase